MSARSIVIIGGGIIGSSIAYYLTRHPKFGPETAVHLVEQCYIAAGASGKAGGFLAKDWHRGPTVALAALSFDLHQSLSDEHGGADRWGYRRVTTLQIQIDPPMRDEMLPDADWVSGVSYYESLGKPETTAQITPNLFTQSMASLAEERGAKIIIATVDGMEFAADRVTPSAVHATDAEGKRITIPATDVIFAAGPWTLNVAKQLLGNKAQAATDIYESPCSTSIIVKSPVQTSAHAFFTDLKSAEGSVSPEIYPRSDGTIYISGDHTDPMRTRPFGSKPTDATPSEVAIEHHKERLALISEKLKDAEVVTTQACWRPESKRHKPLIGAMARLKGVWIASGHSVWGICNAPGTGKVMAELLLDGEAKSANISGLVP